MLNLSAQAQSDLQEGSASSDPGRASDSDIGEAEADIGSEAEDMDIGKQEEREAGAPGPMFQMMNQIQSLIKMSVEKMKHEEKNNSSQKCEYMCVFTNWQQFASALLLASYECLLTFVIGLGMKI